MNNQQFRKLVLDTPARQKDGSGSPPQATGGATPAFGARSRPGVLMTPRNVRGSVESNFARQLASYGTSAHPAPKKFKSSSAPKGTKLAAGYHDRTQARVDHDGDDKAQRIKALEEQLKLEQIDRETFESLRDEITGGDIEATHLVRGLDRKLLARVRRGVDVMSDKKPSEEVERQSSMVDEDEELEALEVKDVAPVVREHTTKKGEMAPPMQVSGAKRKRDAILAELKAARKAAAEAAAAPSEPQLGSHFRKIGREQRIEVDDRGREVLITVGEDGKIKRKIRKTQRDVSAAVQRPDLLEVDRGTKPLGIDVAELPEVVVPEPPDEDDDIFEGVGADYDPLAALGTDEDEYNDNAESEDGEIAREHVGTSLEAPKSDVKAVKNGARNYFGGDEPSVSVFSKPDDAALMATLKKVSAIASKTEGTADDAVGSEEGDRLRRRAAMLANQDRDMDDIDMGFGSSRLDDAEEADGDERVKLSEWKDTTGANGELDDDDGQAGRGGKKRKRGPKKIGDKNSAADVLKAMERKQAG